MAPLNPTTARDKGVEELLSTLIDPKSSHKSFHPKSSQESFHSSHSHQSDSTPSAPPSSQVAMQSVTPSQQVLPSDNGPGLVLHNVDEYIDQQNTHSTKAPQGKKKSPAQQAAPTPSKPKPTGTIVPVQVGAPKSSASIAALNTICQQKGLLIDWDIQQAATLTPGFRGTLTIGTETVMLEETQPSKKDVKQILSERGLRVAERMEARVKSVAEGSSEGGVNENWIGKLLEFYAGDPSGDGPKYYEFTDNMTNFSYEVTLPPHQTPFGDRNTLFKNKKAAKSHAAREAVQSLIQQGYLDADGSVKKKKKAKLGLAVTVERGEEEGEKSWGMKVNDLCTLLSITPPTYRLSPTDPTLAPNVLSGAAYFPHDPTIISLLGPTGGPIGEVRHLLGKNQAKKECARATWEFLEGVRKERLGLS
ncbi:hypothetical protein MMC30_004185 [Trapelia coarctata]|nr:hypothetical protein [Trapelia coarctata]